MNAKDAMRSNLEMSHMITMAYVGDLSDAELFIRPVPGANHIAWQLGHLASSTAHILTGIGHKPPVLPEGFEAKHTKETAGSDDPAQFATKAEYLAAIEAAKAAALAAVEATPDKDLDNPSPESFREYAPTVGAVLLLLANHPLMHAGQYVPVRRKLGKPPIF